MVNYSKSKIYKIQRVGGNSEIYIGSTTKDYLSQRMDSHRSHYKYWKSDNNRTDFVTAYKIFDLYGVENCEIILLESVNCNSKDELRAREGYYIQNNTCVNKNVAGRSVKESHRHYCETNREKCSESKKKYKEKNKEKIKVQAKLYYEKIKEKLKVTCLCECGCEIRKQEKPRHMRSAKHKRLIEALNTK